MEPSNHRRPFCHWASIAIATTAIFCAFATTVSGFSPLSLSLSSSSSSSFSSTGTKTILEAAAVDNNNNNNNNNSDDNAVDNFLTRRQTLSRTASSILAVTAAAAAGSVGVLIPEAAFAADAAAATTTKTTRQEIISKLAGIPTFCLVNGPGAGINGNLDGVPFDIYNADTATATGYFFMSYETAQNALKAASAMDASRGDDNIWTKALIKVVPLSVALQLSLKARRRVSVNEEEGVGGIKVDTIHNLVPSDTGNSDAQTLDTSRNKNAKKWETKGRVPLFYIPEEGTTDKYYFETNDLIEDYKRTHASSDPTMAFLPEIQLAEVIDLFRKAQLSNDWESLNDFVSTIKPLPESRNAAIKILKEEAATKPAPYNFDKVYLVMSAGKK